MHLLPAGLRLSFRPPVGKASGISVWLHALHPNLPFDLLLSSSRAEHGACMCVCIMCVCAHGLAQQVCVLNLQRKGEILLALCWLIWLLVLSFMTRETFWLLPSWGTRKDSSTRSKGRPLGLLAPSQLLSIGRALPAFPSSRSGTPFKAALAQLPFCGSTSLPSPQHSGSVFPNLSKGFAA